MSRKLGDAVKDDELKSIISGYAAQSANTLGSALADDRKKALDYYYGEPLGDEQEGRSQVILTEVHDVVEALMPDFMDIFQGGEKVVEVMPEGQEDIPAAEQATDMLNHVWNVDNRGFDITHDWIKDGLIQRNGFVRADWVKRERIEKETYTNATILDVQRWSMEPGVKITKATSRPDPLDQTLPDGMVYDIEITRETDEGRIEIENIPPEEVLIASAVRSISPRDCPFICHARLLYASDLIEMGISRAEVEKIPAYDGIDNSQERMSRYNRENALWPTITALQEDPAMRRIWLYDTYLRVDRDGDGRAELKRVLCAGPNAFLIIEEDDAEDHPFVDLTPIRMSHTWLGRSAADLTMDIQAITSTILRQTLDNAYNINNGRVVANELVNLDDLLVNRPDGIVRIEGTGPPSNSVMPIPPMGLGNQMIPLLEYMSQVREIRTGVTRYNQGLDASSLNKTATGINAILNQSQRRTKLMARVMAEHGFKTVFKKILRLLVKNGDRKRTIRLRNQWVPMQPSTWNPDMDVRVSVGLGYGNKDMAAQQKQQLLGIQNEIIKLQGGIEGPLVTAENVFELLSKLVNDMGMRQAELFFTDPRGKPPPQPRPDPKIQLEEMRIQGELQIAQKTQQREEQKAGLEIQAKQVDVQLAKKKGENDIQLARTKAAVDVWAIRARTRADIQAKREANAANIQMKREEAAVMLPLKAKALERQASQPSNGKDQ